MFRRKFDIHFNKTITESGLPSGAFEFPPLEAALNPVRTQLVALGTVMPLLSHLVHLSQYFGSTAHRAHEQAGMPGTILILQPSSYLWALQKPVFTEGTSNLISICPAFLTVSATDANHLVLVCSQK